MDSAAPRMADRPLGHLVIIGVGLIGGSVARALKAAGFVARITGVGRNREHLRQAQRLGVIDGYRLEAASAVVDADMVLLAVPMGAYDAVLAEIAEALPPGAVITDAGSTKRHAIAAASRHLSTLARFVPAHPIAGTERSGVEASFAELFRDQLCVLTPTAETDAAALAAAKAMWQACGCRLRCMDAAEHDDFLAAVSHLPHLVAYGLVNAVRKLGDDEHDPFQFAAGGFRDFTRIASSSPSMWRDIVLSNRDAVLDKLARLESELRRLKALIQRHDGEALMQEFAAAKQARDAWLTRRKAVL